MTYTLCKSRLARGTACAAVLSLWLFGLPPLGATVQAQSGEPVTHIVNQSDRCSLAVTFVNARGERTLGKEVAALGHLEQISKDVKFTLELRRSGTCPEGIWVPWRIQLKFLGQGLVFEATGTLTRDEVDTVVVP